MEDAIILYDDGNVDIAEIKVKITECEMQITDLIVKIADWFDLIDGELAIQLTEQIDYIELNIDEILILL